MKSEKYLRIALPTPLRRLFDYLAPQGSETKTLLPGIRVLVPFQTRTLVGFLISVENQSSIPPEKLKPVIEIIDQQPLFPQDVYQLCHWAANYYHYALGEVLATALPTSLRKGKTVLAKIKTIKVSTKNELPPILNETQQQAVHSICAVKNKFKVFLLDGVTGSGKTEVYFQVITKRLLENKQILVLIPEISLTPQTVERFRSRFSVPIVALHSGLSAQERLQAWLAAKTGVAKIIIGTRSAIFTPFLALGLIIVDEEHDLSFKQQDRFRYHARDLAILRAHMQQIPIILGSATPSLESLLNAQRLKYEYLSLPLRAGKAKLPQYQMIDLRRSTSENGMSIELLNLMRIHLDEGNQVLLFLNRRGFAPVLYCLQCAWIENCKRCDSRMVYHRLPERLQCHQCNAHRSVAKQCSQCGEPTLLALGMGTQRLEYALKKHFSSTPVIRIDRDNTSRKGALQKLLEQIHSQQSAILLGTQILAKGHHFPHVTLVGIIDADSGLFSSDFRAIEQMGQLLLQVSGRAGRAEKSGHVVIQTHHPEHPLLQMLIHQGYTAFSKTLLNERELAILPPFCYFAILRAEAYNEQHAFNFLTTIKNKCLEITPSVIVLGPVSALIAKRKGLYCQHLLFKTNQRQELQAFLKKILFEIENMSTHSVKWVLDVDPIEI